jgi:hypothetical protein
MVAMDQIPPHHLQRLLLAAAVVVVELLVLLVEVAEELEKMLALPLQPQELLVKEITVDHPR